MTNWFRALTGFEERSPVQVRENLILEGTVLTSKVNGAQYDCGTLEIRSLKELRMGNNGSTLPANTVTEVVADVQHLHLQAENESALFQVASQFNLLEMPRPEVTPESGVSGYQYDRTQGPACAIACGAGTIFRNYFAEVDGQTGQTSDRQINCLADIGDYLNNSVHRYWNMKNGYVLMDQDGLKRLTSILTELDPEAYDHLKSLLQVGIQRETQVTIADRMQKVTQVYCSALPVAYCDPSPEQWEPFARMILEAAYESTLLQAIENRDRTGQDKVFLTLLGGGAFGNKPAWITDAIVQALQKFRYSDLEIHLVSYGASDPNVRRILEQLE